MANVDTENKRRSIDQIPGLAIYAVADGTIGVGDRADATEIYSGLSYGPFVPGNRHAKGLLTGVY